MKVGILTFHRANNYGAVLQCYALQEFIKQRGHEVWIIDYRQPSIEKVYTYWKWSWFCKKILFPQRMIKYISYVKRGHKKTIYFDSFRNRYLHLTQKYNANHIPSEFDRYIIGSDQLLSINLTHGLDPIYSAKFPVKLGSKKIGYAISSNKPSLDYINSVGWGQFFMGYDAFSLREQSLADYVNTLSGRHIEVCLDPTLLLDEKKWDALCLHSPIYENNIVVYQVRFLPGKEQELMQKAKILSKHINCKIVDLSSGEYNVNEWLSYIKGARCVITSSFHATVFALVFNKPLYSFKLNDGHDERYVDLLESIELHNCICDLNYTPTCLPKYDKTFISSKLTTLRKPSLFFLCSNI